jgi:hypothetical protein
MHLRAQAARPVRVPPAGGAARLLPIRLRTTDAHRGLVGDDDPVVVAELAVLGAPVPFVELGCDRFGVGPVLPHPGSVAGAITPLGSPGRWYVSNLRLNTRYNMGTNVPIRGAALDPKAEG